MFKKNKLLQCTITLTRNCNLRCLFCYAKESGYIEKDLISYEDITKIIDFCDSAKVKYVVFTGGEPVTYPKLTEILHYINTKRHKVIPAMATNGVLLEDFEKCKQLVDNGIKYIDISLKGSSDKECLEIVGKDCFSQQMKAIKNLSKLNVELTCSMVLTMHNINSFCKAIGEARNNGAKQFSFTFVIDNSESKEKGVSYLEKNNPLKLIDAFIKQIDKLNSITNNWWIEYSYPTCFYTEEQLKLLENKLATKCQIHTKNCITIDTKLNLLPCNMHTNISLGHFGVDFTNYKEFEKLRKNNVYSQITRELDTLPSKECLSCKHLKSCRGGCPITWKNYTYEEFKEFKELIKRKV